MIALTGFMFYYSFDNFRALFSILRRKTTTTTSPHSSSVWNTLSVHRLSVQLNFMEIWRNLYLYIYISIFIFFLPVLFLFLFPFSFVFIQFAHVLDFYLWKSGCYVKSIKSNWHVKEDGKAIGFVWKEQLYCFIRAIRERAELSIQHQSIW